MSLPLLDVDAPWRDSAACLGSDSDLFFIEQGRGYTAAKKICDQCYVTEDCLNYALEARIGEGVWGGLTPRERRRARTRTRRRVA